MQSSVWGRPFILSDTMIFICRVFLALVQALGMQFPNLSYVHRVRVIGEIEYQIMGGRSGLQWDECGSVMRQHLRAVCCEPQKQGLQEQMAEVQPQKWGFRYMLLLLRRTRRLSWVGNFNKDPFQQRLVFRWQGQAQ